MAETKFIRTKKERNYTTLDNTFIRDTTLSWKAKGVMTYLLSLPDDWVVYLSEIQKHASDGRDSLRTAVAELLEKGYLVRVQNRTGEGKFGSTSYEIVESPAEKPFTEKPFTENPSAENPKLLNTNNTNDLYIPNTKGIYTAKEKPKRTRKPFTTTYEQVLNICIKNGFKGMNDAEGKLAEWFCKVALNEDGTVCYKGNVIKSYIGLVSILRSIDVSGKSYSKVTPSKRVRSTINEGCF